MLHQTQMNLVADSNCLVFLNGTIMMEWDQQTVSGRHVGLSFGGPIDPEDAARWGFLASKMA